MYAPAGPGLLSTLETYYDTAPRASADTEEIGPFTLFVATDPDGHPYYARPRLGLDGPVRESDVRRVLARQRELGVPLALEWVDAATPSLLPAARAAGMEVRECPLLVLPAGVSPGPRLAAGRVRVVEPDDPDLPATLGAVSAGFAGTDEVTPRDPRRRARLGHDGLVVTAAAYDDGATVVGGGSHGPRGDVTEVTGIAVLPRARRQGLGAALAAALALDALSHGVATVFLSAQDHAVARVYERVGFVHVGTACLAEPAGEAL